MAVKVGGSWVSEAAYAYAKSKQAEPKGKEGMLSQLSEKYAGTKFSTNTEPFSGEGVNNISISPNILNEMVKDPEKKLEYEALIYDCVELQKTLPGQFSQNGSRLKAFGFTIDHNGGLSAWSISEPAGKKGNDLFQCRLPKKGKQGWAPRILSRKQAPSYGARNKKHANKVDVRA